MRLLRCHQIKQRVWVNNSVESGMNDNATTTKQNITILCSLFHGPLARYVKMQVAHAPGMPGTFSPPPQVSDPGMYHGTCVTPVP